MRIANRKCPICSDQKVEVLHTQRFELPKGHPLEDGYDVVVCLGCGFVYADTSFTQEAYDRFYAQFSKYEDAKTGTGGGEKPWDRERLEKTAQQIADFLQNDQARILDIGCANGGLLKALKDLGYQSVCGIDPSPVCVENTRSLGLECYLGSLFQPSNLGEFDCVILSHTLEHVQDLSLALKFVIKVLRKDATAVFYAEVPDATRYQEFVFSPYQDFNTEHINHFSSASLANLLHENGFKIIQAGDKLFETSPNMPYPAIFAFARVMPNERKFVADQNLRSAIEAYIELSTQLLADMETRIQHALSIYDRVIVWGTGQLAMKLLIETSLRDANIVAFVDSNPINHGKNLRGVKIISPEAVRLLPDPIVITSTLHQENIALQIRAMGLSNDLIFLRN